MPLALQRPLLTVSGRSVSCSKPLCLLRAAATLLFWMRTSSA